MKHLLQLELHNFGPFRGWHVFRLDAEGITAITGLNLVNPGQRVNGAGKSALLDALLWGLTGATGPRKETSTDTSGLKTDEVINEVAGKGAIVRVSWAAGDNLGQEYRVERWRKAKNSDERRLKASGVRLDVRQEGDAEWHSYFDVDSEPTQQEIEKLIGFDRSLMLKLLVRSQEDLYHFAQAKPKERFQLLTEIEGVDELDVVERRARDRGLEIMREVQRLTAMIAGKEQALAMFREDDPQTQAAEWEATRAQAIERTHARLTQIAHEQAGLGALTDEKPALIAEMERLNSALAVLVTQPEPPEVQQWRDTLLTQNGLAAAAKAKLDIVDAQLTKLGRQSGVCLECGQVVDEAHVQSRHATLEHERGDYLAELHQADTLRNQAQQVIDTSNAEMEAYRRAIQTQRDEVNQQLTQVRNRIYQCEQAAAQRARWDAEAARLSDEVRRRQLETNPHLNRADEARKRVEAMTAEIEEHRAEAARLNTEAGLVEWWVRAVPSVKSWIFDSVVGEITLSANRWLQHFMSGTCIAEVTSTATTKGGKVKDEIGLKLFRWEHNAWHERPFRQWSGGEKRRIDLALDWALMERMSQRARFNAPFMALDEIDRHLDAEGREGLLSALAELKQDKTTIWIVSQDKDFNAAPDRQWTIIKDEGGSRLEESHGQE